VLNRPVSAALGERLAAAFVEVLYAPGYDEVALEAVVRKGAVRVLNDLERRRPEAHERDLKRVLGGLLVQERDWDVEDREGMEVATGEPTEAQWGDLLFAARVCKHVASNAIVIVNDLQTIGIGAGQMSRVDAVRIALEKAREHGHSLEGASLASDAFFPFPDGPQLALDAGVAAFVQPGGSKRDAEVIEVVESAGAAMVYVVNVRSAQPIASLRNAPAKAASPRASRSAKFSSENTAITNSTTAASSRMVRTPRFISSPSQWILGSWTSSTCVFATTSMDPSCTTRRRRRPRRPQRRSPSHRTRSRPPTGAFTTRTPSCWSPARPSSGC
jgi:hypothetical protein